MYALLDCARSAMCFLWGRSNFVLQYEQEIFTFSSQNPEWEWNWRVLHSYMQSKSREQKIADFFY